MSTKPDALRLAEDLLCPHVDDFHETCEEASLELCCLHNSLESETAARIAAQEELTKCRERLDFLANSPPRFIEMSTIGMWRVYEDKASIQERAPNWRAMTPDYHQTPREAIDAAISASMEIKS